MSWEVCALNSSVSNAQAEDFPGEAKGLLPSDFYESSKQSFSDLQLCVSFSNKSNRSVEIRINRQTAYLRKENKLKIPTV